LRVSGKLAPVREKLDPPKLAELTVTAEAPLEVSVTGSVDDEPTVTSPKSRLRGLTVSCGEPGDEDAEPVPLRPTVIVGLVEELLLMASELVAAPAALG
jgi:hypothetical protein